MLMSETGSRTLILALAAALILFGILAPPANIVAVFGPSDAELAGRLATGAVLFKISLVLLGSYLVFLRWWLAKHGPTLAPARSLSGREVAFLAALAAVAFLLRLPGLNSGLWFDEILTYVDYARLPFGKIVSTYASENQHFLFSLLAHACFEAFGEGAFALRLPAVLFGVASVCALYLVGREVTTALEAGVAATVVTVSYHHIWFSQNARGYTGLLFWTLLSTWFFVRGLREDNPRAWILYGVSCALGVYTHITMAFVIAGQLIVYLGRMFGRTTPSRSRYLGLLAGFCLGGLLTLALHALVLPQVAAGMKHTVSVVEAWKHPFWTALEFMRALQVNFAGAVAGVVALALFGAGVLSFLRTKPVLVWLLVLPALLGAAVVMGAGHHLWPRFFFFAMGFGALTAVRGVFLAGEGAARLFGVGSRRTAFALAISGCIVAVSASSAQRAWAPKQDYEGARDFVNANRRPGDEVVMVGLATFPYRELYRVPWSEVRSIAELEDVRARATRTWVVYTLRTVLESMAPEVLAVLERDFTVLKRFPGTLQGGTVFVCLSENPSKAGPISRFDIGLGTVGDLN
jgi:hypothetical protein